MKSMGPARVRVGRLVGAAVLATLSGAAWMSVTARADAATASPKAALQASWRAAISQTPTPSEGCFKASYPSRVWSKVGCVTAPQVPYIPRTGGHGAFTVGDGNDYAIKVKGTISSGVGSFPVVAGLKSETGYGGQPNTYTLQLNSEFFNGPVCAGAKKPKKCLTWLQYVYSSSEQAVFMQYWLIFWNTTCPAGWNTYRGDCYKNSAAVRAPTIAITELPNLVLTGSAVKGGVDTSTLMTSTDAYTTTGKDTVVDLASSWDGSEFNIIGDGGGSAANFNKGTSLTVNLAVNDGKTKAPTCESDAGTTGETNNLTLGACTTAGGATPSISFVESN